MRLRAEAYARDDEFEKLLAMLPELREDVEFWPHLWGPTAAIAA